MNRHRRGERTIPDSNGQRRPVQSSWPDLTCFGCGSANPEGLHLQSYLSTDGTALEATFTPRPIHTAGVANVAYGGLIASLVDCNSIWTAMTFRNLSEGLSAFDPPAVRYVTGRLSVEYRRPTPLDEPIHLRSWVDGDVGRKSLVRTELGPPGDVTATGEVLAVAIRPH